MSLKTKYFIYIFIYFVTIALFCIERSGNMAADLFIHPAFKNFIFQADLKEVKFNTIQLCYNEYKGVTAFSRYNRVTFNLISPQL